MSSMDQRLATLSPENRALLMQQLARKAVAMPQNDIGRRVRPERLPLSSAQQRLWILDQIDPGNSVYNVTSLMRFHGHLDIDVLERTLSEIVRRHESLRTVFVKDEEGPRQVILPAEPLRLVQHDVSNLHGDAREEAAMALATADAGAPFDLAKGPVLRATLIRVAADEALLLLSAHHIAVDGWSFGVVYGELTQLYAAFLADQPSPLPELAIQYADYTLWQLEEAQSGSAQTQLEYWKQRFATPPPVLELPGDRPRPPIQSYRGNVLGYAIPNALYDEVKRFSRQEGATAFMTFLAVFHALLSRYSGQDDIVVGVGNANRPRREIEALVGFFINTLPLRVDMSGNPTFRELLAQVKASTIDSYANQDVPVERLIESLNIERSLGHSPLFQTMVFYQNFPEQTVELPGVTLLPVRLDSAHSGTARADLSIFANESPDGLMLLIEYASDLFDHDYIEGFAGHLEQLMRSVVENPGRRLSELEILSAEERKRLRVDLNATARPMPAEATIHAMFEAQVSRSPHVVALVQGETRLTYAELDAQAAAIAAKLRAQGCGPGTMVGLFLDRTPLMVAALLGTLKSGAAYVPLDPSYPADRIGFMLEDSSAPVVITEDALAGQLPAGAYTLLRIQDALAAPAPAVPIPSPAGAEDTAYVIFTSGSTGRPKGVCIPHRAAVNFLASMAREPGLVAADTLCAITTLSFDIALLELMLPLTVGARVALADRVTASDGQALAAMLETVDASVMQATPATWRMLLDAGWRGRPAMRLFCGGEALPRDLADRLLDCCSELWNVYGPTETTVWSTVERVQRDTTIAIGRPIDNTEVYIVDKHLQLVPMGIPGELLIGGLGVAKGYLDRPELTAEKFIADTLGQRPDGRLYRTGDLARWRRDGRLEAIGRIDHQVKLRGFRIELGEIESVLAAHDAVAQAVVICREDRPGDKQLVAYLVAAGGEIDIAALRTAARERLPEYMMPSAFVTMERLPLTPNGKVDRRALPAPDADAFAVAEYTPPRNAEEEALVALWADVLGKPQIGIHDNFFDLGGHSLLATQLVTRMQKTMGADIGLRMMFEAPTVAQFAELLLKNRMKDIDEDSLAAMLQQLEGLSEDDIQAILAG